MDAFARLSPTLLQPSCLGVCQVERAAFKFSTLSQLENKLLHRARALLSRGLGSRMVSGFVLVAMLTVISKGVSFLKDAAVVRQFGISDELDAFMFSFGLLTFIGALIGGGLPEAFLPLYAEVTHQKSPVRARRLAIQGTFLHAASLFLACVVLYFLAPQFVGWTTRGFTPEKQALAAGLMRQLLPFMACLGLGYQLGTWLRADKHFQAATSAPMLVPLAVIAALLLDWRSPDARTLVLGTLAGGFLQVLVLVIVLWRGERLTLAFVAGCLRNWEPEVRQMLRKALPFLFAGAIFNTAVVVDQTMAAWLEAGSVVVLGYTDKVCGIILAVTAAPSCDVLFPYFADKVARRDWIGVRRQLFTSAGVVLSAGLPAALLLSAFAPWVVQLLFERGSFTPEDTERVAAVLRYAALQIPFYILGSLASRVVVALQATNFIILIACFATVGNALLNLLFMRTMGAAGIALSTVLVQMLSAGLACLYVLRQIKARLAQNPPD